MLKGINHLTFSVGNLEQSIAFYRDVLEAKLLAEGNNLAYFSLNGMWIALNVHKKGSRKKNHQSYTHIAFTIDESDFDIWLNKLTKLKVNIVPGRSRDEQDKRSIYFSDQDGHLFELHTGSLEDRLQFYREEKPNLSFYD
jgi:metallothiol transferase